MGMQGLRKHFRVPAKRGMRVRSGLQITREGTVVSCYGKQSLKVRLDTGEIKFYDPYELDYHVGGVWILGREIMHRNPGIQRHNDVFIRSHGINGG